MFNIVLYQPEIPPNTGNIIRLCANTGCRLKLVEPLSFDMNNKKLRRAGLDYHEWAKVETHPDLASACRAGGNIYAISTRGARTYTDARLKAGDTLVFGPETRGLPDSYLDSLDQDMILRIPMLKKSRSLNLSNAVAVVVYEGLRQNRFADEGTMR
jgi:tRNA (cytidine/uridine-2'-O-)-methyltransferase